MIARGAFMTALALTATAMLAAPARAGDLAVTEAWTPLGPPNAPVRAVYFTLGNHGSEPRRLIGVAVEGYAMAHLHRSQTVDGVAAMARLDAVEAPPGGAVRFAPGGLHVMAMGREASAELGAPVALTLIFADGERITVDAAQRSMADAVKDDGAEPGAPGHDAKSRRMQKHGTHEHGHGS